MIPLPAFSIGAVPPILARDIIDAVAMRPGESASDQQLRAQEVMGMLAAFETRDAVEAMFAGQAVVFQNLVLDATRDAGRAETGEAARRHRQSAVAMSRLHLAWFKELQRHRAERYPAADSVDEVPESVTVAPPAAAAAAARTPGTSAPGTAAPGTVAPGTVVARTVAPAAVVPAAVASGTAVAKTVSSVTAAPETTPPGTVVPPEAPLALAPDSRPSAPAPGPVAPRSGEGGVVSYAPAHTAVLPGLPVSGPRAMERGIGGQAAAR